MKRTNKFTPFIRMVSGRIGAVCLLLMLCMVAAGAAPIIYDSTESAMPGQIAGFTGTSFTTSPKVYFYKVLGTESSITGTTVKNANHLGAVLAASAQYVSARIPNNLGVGLIAAVVYDGTNTSNVVYINQARCTGFDVTEVSPSYPIRLFGRNLMLNGATPQVWFVNNGTTYTGAVLTGDRYVLTVTAPSNLPTTGTNTILVTNGYGYNSAHPAYAQTTAAQGLTSCASGTDPWGLHVPWASDFATVSSNVYNVKTDSRLTTHAVGDGNTNDLAAIQAAVSTAGNAGGGVVYLPAGVYNIDIPAATWGIGMANNVVIKGDGRTATILKYGESGYSQSPSDGEPVVINATDCGLMDVGIVNCHIGVAEQAGAGGGAVMFTSCNKCFLLRCSINASSRACLENYAPAGYSENNILLGECDFNETPNIGYNAPVGFAYPMTNLVMRGCTANFTNKTIAVEAGQNILVDATHVSRVYSRNLDCTDDREYDLNGSNFTLLGDAITTLNWATLDPNNNDGEAILFQGTPSNYDVGTASASSSTTITDSTKAWTANAFAGQVIAITGGTGAGQWRRILSNTATAITIDTTQGGNTGNGGNWNPTPAANCTYSINDFLADSCLIKDNWLYDNHRGIWFWEGGHDLAIANNRLTDSLGISLHAYQSDAWKEDIFYHTLAADNLVQDVTGNWPAYVGADEAWSDWGYGDKTLFPMAYVGTELRRNRVEAPATNPVLYTGETPWTDGYFNFVTFQPSQSWDAPYVASIDPTNNSILGTILENNVAINGQTSGTSAYYIGTGDAQTTLKEGSLTPGLTAVTDTTGNDAVDDFDGGTYTDNAGHGSTGTSTTPPLFAYTPGEFAQFEDNFGTNNPAGNDGWATLTGSSWTIASNSSVWSWSPTAAGVQSVQYTLPAGVDIRQGPITVYFAMRTSNVTGNTAGQCWVELKSSDGTNYLKLLVNPGAAGSFADASGTVATSASTFANTTAYVPFRLVATLNADDQTLSYSAAYYSGTSWTSLGSVTQIPSGTIIPVGSGTFSTLQLSTGSTTTVAAKPYISALAVTQATTSICNNLPFAYGQGEAEQFRDTFDFGNINGWSSLGGSYAFTNGVWTPTATGWSSAAVTLPQSLGIDITKGPISVYCRACTGGVTSGSNGQFWTCLIDSSSTGWMETDVDPGSGGAAGDPNGWASTSASTFANSEAYVDFRSTATSNGNGTMTITQAYYNTSVTPPVWTSLGTVTTINGSSIPIGTGLFTQLRVGASISALGNAPSITAVAVTQTPNAYVYDNPNSYSTLPANYAGGVPQNNLLCWLRPDIQGNPGGGTYPDYGVVCDQTTGNVNAWADFSGNAMDATQTTAADEPTYVANALNGYPVLRFNGTSDFLSLPSGFSNFTNGVSIFVVGTPTAANSYARFLDLGDGQANNNIVLYRDSTSTTLDYGTMNGSTWNTWLQAANALPVGSSVLLEAVEDSAGNTNLYSSGTLLVSGTGAVPPTVTRTSNFIGKSNWSTDGLYQGDIAEILIYNAGLSTADRQAVEKYLRTKYNL